MENSGPLILDISSDEETGFGSGSQSGEYDIGKGELTEDDCFWLTRLLDEVDGNKDDDSDDVVVVSEMFPKPCKKSGLESLKPSRKVGESIDDDDCVVLDGDPDKPVVVVNARVEGNEDDANESDDLEIVGEKGEVACRDFPHARHLCVKFLFASTPHEFHCSQCHCYVCDCLAPCSHWGTGISTVDHCHANDNEECWRAERKRMKKGCKPMPNVPTVSNTYPLEPIFETPQVPDPPQYSPLPLTQGLSPVPIHPCTVSSGASVPTAVNQGRIHPSGHVPMNRPRPDLVSLQSGSTHYNCVPSRGGSNNAGSRSAQSFTPHAVLKRPGIIRSFPNNRNASGPRLHRSSHIRRYQPFQMANGRHGSNPVGIVRRAVAPPVLPPTLSSQPGMAVGRLNYVPSSLQMHSRAYSSYPIRDPLQFQSQTSCQLSTPTVFGSAVQLQLKLPSQPSVENLEDLINPQSRDAFQPNSPFSSQYLPSHLSDGVAALGDKLHSRSMISSPSSVGNNFESQPSQPQAHFSPASLVTDDHNYNQQQNHSHKGLDASPADFGINYESSFSAGNQEIDVEVSQRQAAAPDDSSQVQYLTETNDHRLGAAVEDSHSPGAVLVDNASQINGTYGHLPESTNSDLNFHLDNWMFESDFLPGAFEVPLSPGWNEFSPDPAASLSIDTGTLFDI